MQSVQDAETVILITTISMLSTQPGPGFDMTTAAFVRNRAGNPVGNGDCWNQGPSPGQEIVDIICAVNCSSPTLCRLYLLDPHSDIDNFLVGCFGYLPLSSWCVYALLIAECTVQSKT